MKLTATIPSFRVSTQLKQQLTEAAKELGGRRSYAIRQKLIAHCRLLASD